MPVFVGIPATGHSQKEENEQSSLFSSSVQIRTPAHDYLEREISNLYTCSCLERLMYLILNESGF